ncbi:hypothetical protein FOPG_18388 [Fusarium oxysporum f. sp. conglutinans race 2 54008]|uniref:Uncharacterized protein n=1 Tax=Fusarium oxysporum f. sp. conglutinans race 2 54008 TaxID=1089457 RepID=X0GQ08_FUSOX|nr:hypothetical protein FOPG_18388 [Fusarium oxysporum f. sp. conglutinans race 2 54008]
MSGENLPSKIQQALDRFDRENKRVGYACTSHDHIVVNLRPGSRCDQCKGTVTEIPVQAYREVTTGYTLTQYGWETVDKDGEWVPGKGDKRWKDYSKRMWFDLAGLYSH